MTRDELKEKVARAIYKHQREFNEKPSDDFDCQPAWLRGAMMGAAEAALSAIEGAGMAVVPVEPDDVFWATVDFHDGRHSRSGETYPVQRNLHRAMVEAGRVR